MMGLANMRAVGWMLLAILVLAPAVRTEDDPDQVLPVSGMPAPVYGELAEDLNCRAIVVASP